jgi:hypothetical protein
MQRLFGGALECSLPFDGTWVDVSDALPVPDNQECFQLGPATLVIEIVEWADIDDATAPAYYWKDLLEQTGASEMPGTTLEVMPGPALSLAHELMKHCTGGIASGLHAVRRSDTSTGAETVLRATLGVIRLPDFQADVLFTLTDISESAIAAAPPAVAAISSVLSSFQIIDPTLFTPAG